MIINMILIQFISYIFMAFTFGACISWLFSSYVDERRTKCNQDHVSHVLHMDQLYINRLLDHISSLEGMLRDIVKNKLESKNV